MDAKEAIQTLLKSAEGLDNRLSLLTDIGLSCSDEVFKITEEIRNELINENEIFS